ncbi:MAG: ribosome maturation factor RimP [Bacteroidales bacterium]
MKEKLIKIALGAPLKKTFEIIEVVESKDNSYTIYIESLDGISIDDCATMSRYIFEQLPQETNIELTVSSAGIDKPLRAPIQFLKNIGRKVEVKTNDGKKHTGTLVKYTKENITLHVESKNKTTKELILEQSIIKQVKVKLF